MKVKALKLFDYDFANEWKENVEDQWIYEDFKNNEAWRKGWISFDCACYNEENDSVYLGITSFDADIFRAYDRKKKEFVDLGYSAIANPYDAKFHRSLEKGSDGSLYAAIALLHCSDRFLDAPGSPIIKYDPLSEKFTKISLPIPHVYIQAIALDNERQMLYGQCLAPEYAFSFNLKTGEFEIIALVGSGYGGLAQGQNIALDNSGGVWFNWSLTRAWQDSPGIDGSRLCKYDPDAGKMVFFQRGLPRRNGLPGTVKAEAFHCFDDEFMYASGDNGSLYRIDPKDGRAEYMFTPIADRPSRLASLAKGEDGMAYGVIGCQGNCELLKFDYRNDSYELLGKINDDNGAAMWQCHDIVHAGKGVFYACENDNPFRSSYLWELCI